MTYRFRASRRLLREVGSRLVCDVPANREADYQAFVTSGLYERLVNEGLLLPHERGEAEAEDMAAALVATPAPFPARPYEWCFAQLQAAAVTLLRAQLLALEQGMVLRHASAYTIVFRNNRPLLADPLAFTLYGQIAPWPAYGQFCRMFLAPLLLMAMRDIRMSQLLRIHLDGIPIDLASRLLPQRTRFDSFINAHMHQRSRNEGAPIPNTLGGIRHLTQDLLQGVQRIRWSPPKKEAGRFYGSRQYSKETFDSKRDTVVEWLTDLQPRMMWDLGAAIGTFTMVAARLGCFVVAMESNPLAVEKLYRSLSADAHPNTLPLWVDLTNPGGAHGWMHTEVDGLLDRPKPDCVLGLDLLHYLTLKHGVTFEQTAAFLCAASPNAIVDFAPPEAPRVEELLARLGPEAPAYTQETFEAAFSPHFDLVEKRPIAASPRMLYRFARKSPPA